MKEQLVRRIRAFVGDCALDEDVHEALDIFEELLEEVDDE